MRNIFVFGATSAIAEATARLFAADGDKLFLVARDAAKLQAVADDIRVRGAALVVTAVSDAGDFDRHGALVDEAYQCLGGLDTAIIAHGTLADQKECETSFQSLRREFEINALSVMSLLTHLANRFQRQGFGTIGVISSVAGDRGRQSNYVYGAAKAAVTVFLQGLRNRLFRTGVHVLTIKPGFVDTPMTAHIPKGLLWVAPRTVAVDIHKAIQKKKTVVYVPWFWRPIMRLICVIPERIFRRMQL